MSVIARDTVASDHLVYAWPFPIGPEECEVTCAEDEQVVICPSWVVGGMFGPGRHRFRSPNPMQPTAAYFVLTAPVEVSFDFITMFQLPTTGGAVRIRSAGSLQVRCSDASLLIAQFVGLPFDAVNDDILRSVSRSVERMLARLLTRRVVMAGTAQAVTDPQMLGQIVEELVAYNPAAGAVFGVELVRMGHISIAADDGTRPLDLMFSNVAERAKPPEADTLRGQRGPASPTIQPMAAIPPVQPSSQPAVSGELAPASGEIIPKARGSNDRNPPPIPRSTTKPPTPPLGVVAMPTTPPPPVPPAMAASSSTTVTPPPPAPTPRMMPAPPPVPKPEPRRAGSVEVPQTEETTQPHSTPVPGALRVDGAGAAVVASAAPAAAAKQPKATVEARGEPRGAILGIGMAHIGGSELASGEIPQKVAPGARVLVPGPDGLMQSATVRQLLQGYYELEVGGSGETIWVPVTGVVPES